MKTFVCISILLSSTLALATTPEQVVLANHHCVNEAGESLDVTVIQARPAQAKAVVTGGDSKIETFSGWQLVELPFTYALTSDQTGKNATLTFSYPKTYGGRCGRCEPGSGYQDYYAKLQIEGQELNFTCPPF
ncbi:hypothetical protein ACES2L_05335 [Bdellovibrio bacteriovorus]